MSKINGVRTEIPERPGSGGVFFQFPIERMIRIREPALLVGSAPVVDFSDLAVIDHLFCESNGWATTVVVIHVMNNAGLFGCVEHRGGFIGIAASGLFTKDVLPGLGSGDRWLGVKVSRKRNINHVDVITLDDFSPVRLDLGPAPSIGKELQIFGITTTSDLQNGSIRWIEELGDLAPPVRMSSPHETVTENSYTKIFHAKGNSLFPRTAKVIFLSFSWCTF
jgi:hypothetical protein